MKITIAVDGFSGSGKSTLAKDLANSLGYLYLDTGAMYRAVTWLVLEKELLANEAGIARELEKVKIELKKDGVMVGNTMLRDELRTMRVSESVSIVATYACVRQKLVSEQQRMANGGGVVMDGRDIGTVVLPNADLKLFVTAGLDIRAERRFKEIKSRSLHITLAGVKENLRMRDETDTTRKIGPLKIADKAVVLDNSNLSREEQLKFALALVAPLKDKNLLPNLL